MFRKTGWALAVSALLFLGGAGSAWSDAPDAWLTTKAKIVLLSGETKTLDAKLRAIEVVYSAPGVKRVATEIQTGEK